MAQFNIKKTNRTNLKTTAPGKLAISFDQDGKFVVIDENGDIVEINPLPIVGTHAQILALKHANSGAGALIPGTDYMITDFKTKYLQEITGLIKEAESIETLVLKATSPKTFDIRVQSVEYPKDVLEYDIEDDVCEDGDWDYDLNKFVIIPKSTSFYVTTDEFISDPTLSLNYNNEGVETSPLLTGDHLQIIVALRTWLISLNHNYIVSEVISTNMPGKVKHRVTITMVNNEDWTTNVESGILHIENTQQRGTPRKGKIIFRKDDKNNRTSYDHRTLLNYDETNDFLTFNGDCRNTLVEKCDYDNVGRFYNNIIFYADTWDTKVLSNCADLFIWSVANCVFESDITNINSPTKGWVNTRVRSGCIFTGIDFSTASYINETYHTDIFKNSAGDIKLGYYDASNVYQIVAVNS